MSTVPQEFHFAYPFLNTNRRNLGRSMLYSNDYTAFPAVTAPVAPVAGAITPPGGVPVVGQNAVPPIGGGQVKGPPQAAPVPMMPPMPAPKTGILDTLKQHKILVIGLVVALILIIAILYLIFRKKKGRGKRR